MDRTVMREIVQNTLKSWAEFLPVSAQLQNVLVFDTDRDHYVFSRVGWEDGQHVNRIVIHLAIQDEKIWVHTDNTETGVVTDLIERGMTPDAIVMAFRPAWRRELSLASD